LWIFLSRFSYFPFLSQRDPPVSASPKTQEKTRSVDFSPAGGACQKRHLTDINSTEPIAAPFLLAAMFGSPQHASHGKSGKIHPSSLLPDIATQIPDQALEPPRADLRLPNQTFSVPALSLQVFFRRGLVLAFAMWNIVEEPQRRHDLPTSSDSFLAVGEMECQASVRCSCWLQDLERLIALDPILSSSVLGYIHLAIVLKYREVSPHNLSSPASSS
jgi:hypothetical protein